jgi:quinoprotein glucose dehydrogenase
VAYWSARIGACLAGASLLISCALGASTAAAPVVGPAPQRAPEQFLPTPPGYRAVPWVSGLEAPWSLVFPPDGRALVSERPGRIRLIRDGVLESAPYASFDVVSGAGASGLAMLYSLVARGEGGLMGLAVHPDFPRQPFIYAMETYQSPQGVRNRIVRLRDEGSTGRFDRVVFDGIPGSTYHDGGRIAFGPDSMLYVTTGETFEARLAQDRSSLAGKILRLTPEGGVPVDNPFPGSPIYSYGHRNPQGLAWHPQSGMLFESEHGPTGEFGLSAFDEINIIRAGGNYGWPLAVGAPGRPGLVDPILVWTGIAVPPSGIAFYKGDLFVAALGAGALIRVQVVETGSGYRVSGIERWFASGPEGSVLGRIRDVVVGQDSRLYFLTSNRDGRGEPRAGDDHVYRLEPTGK